MLNENVCVPVALRVDGEAVINDGIAHVMLPMPLPMPENVQVVLKQLTPAPVNVKGPPVELMEETPLLLENVNVFPT